MWNYFIKHFELTSRLARGFDLFLCYTDCHCISKFAVFIIYQFDKNYDYMKIFHSSIFCFFFKRFTFRQWNLVTCYCRNVSDIYFFRFSCNKIHTQIMTYYLTIFYLSIEVYTYMIDYLKKNDKFTAEIIENCLEDSGFVPYCGKNELRSMDRLTFLRELILWNLM